MRLVTNTECIGDALGHRDAIRLIAKAGFDGIDGRLDAFPIHQIIDIGIVHIVFGRK